MPEKEEFYSKLNDEHITDEESNHAQKEWEAFGCKSLGDYHDIYLGNDVALLADVFEKIRELSLPQAVRASPRAIIHVPRFELGRTDEEGQNRVKPRGTALDGRRQVPFHRDRDAGRHLNGEEALFEGKKPAIAGL